MKDNKLRLSVLDCIHYHWPIHPSGVCRKLNIDANVSNISKIRYYFESLQREGAIHTTKIDRALVAWPANIDKLRVVHDFIKDL